MYSPEAAVSPVFRPPDTPRPGPLIARIRGSSNPLDTDAVSSSESSHTTITSSTNSSCASADSTACLRKFAPFRTGMMTLVPTATTPYRRWRNSAKAHPPLQRAAPPRLKNARETCKSRKRIHPEINRRCISVRFAPVRTNASDCRYKKPLPTRKASSKSSCRAIQYICQALREFLPYLFVLQINLLGR